MTYGPMPASRTGSNRSDCEHGDLSLRTGRAALGVRPLPLAEYVVGLPALRLAGPAPRAASPPVVRVTEAGGPEAIDDPAVRQIVADALAVVRRHNAILEAAKRWGIADQAWRAWATSSHGGQPPYAIAKEFREAEEALRRALAA